MIPKYGQDENNDKYNFLPTLRNYFFIKFSMGLGGRTHKNKVIKTQIFYEG